MCVYVCESVRESVHVCVRVCVCVCPSLTSGAPGIVESNPGKFRLGENELQERRAFVEQTRVSVQVPPPGLQAGSRPQGKHPLTSEVIVECCRHTAHNDFALL